MRILLILILFLSVTSCNSQDSLTLIRKNPRQFRDFYSLVTQQFIVIDSLRKADYDSLEQANNKLSKIIAGFKENIFSFPDTFDYDLLYIVKSSDKNLALISWDTRMGGTLIDFTTMALYKAGNYIIEKMLIDTTNEDQSHTLMHYNSVHTITTSIGKKVYLAWVTGKVLQPFPGKN